MGVCIVDIKNYYDKICDYLEKFDNNTASVGLSKLNLQKRSLVKPVYKNSTVNFFQTGKPIAPKNAAISIDKCG